MVPAYEQSRRHPRILGRHQAQVRRLGPRALEATLRTRDIGPGGCAFLSGGLLGLGAVLEMVINVSGTFVEAEGKVVYERRKADGTVEVGVCFTNLPPPGPQVIERLVAASPGGRRTGRGAAGQP
jgi:hypothetical protein